MDWKGFSKLVPGYHGTMLLIVFVFNRKNQLKIVNNVVFVKINRNFSLAINALLTC